MIRIPAVAVLALTLAASAASATPGTVSFTASGERDLTFRNGDVELSGTLLVPSGTGPFPAVVFLPGSGPHVRAGFKPYADEFAKLGVASLFYDKRGSGESKGSWVTSSLDDLANDAVAAVTLLKGMKEIDSTRIGFWGVSQGGWVAPLAASKMGNAAFLIVVSGGGVTPRESEMFAYRQHFKRMGLSPADTTKAVAILDEYFRFLATGKDREKVAARLVEIQKGTLAPLAEHLGGILPSQENQRNWAWVATYDQPAPAAARVSAVSFRAASSLPAPRARAADHVRLPRRPG